MAECRVFTHLNMKILSDVFLFSYCAYRISLPLNYIHLNVGRIEAAFGFSQKYYFITDYSNEFEVEKLGNGNRPHCFEVSDLVQIYRGMDYHPYCQNVYICCKFEPYNGTFIFSDFYDIYLSYRGLKHNLVPFLY